MSVTTIDLDDDALARALRVCGGATREDVVNTALREYAERHERTTQRARHIRAAQEWDYEGWQQLHDAGKPGGARSDRQSLADSTAVWRLLREH